MKKGFVVFVWLLLPITAVGQLGQPPSPENDSLALKVQLDAERYREDHFGHGEFLVRRTELTEGNDGKLIDGNAVTQRLWVDGEQIRKDVIAGAELHRVSLTGKKYISEVDSELDVVVAPQQEYPDPRAHFGVFNPRWIGMGFNSPFALSQGRAHRCLKIPEKGPLGVDSIGTEELNGVITTKLHFESSGKIDLSKLLTQIREQELQEGSFGDEGENETNSSGGFDDEADGKGTVDGDGQVGGIESYSFQNTLWFAPSQGNGLIKCVSRTSYPDRGVETVQELNAEYRRDDATGVWFPREVVTTTRSNGDLSFAFRDEIAEASFARPAPSVFQLNGFKLPVDRRISDRTLGPHQKNFFWDGTKPILIPGVLDLAEPILRGRKRKN